MLLPQPCPQARVLLRSILLAGACTVALAFLAGPAQGAPLTPAALPSLVRPADSDLAAPPQEAISRLRGRHTLAILASTGRRPQVTVRAVSIDRSTDPTSYQAEGDGGRILARGTCAPGAHKTFTLPTNARCLLSVNAGRGAATVHVADGAAGLPATAEAPARFHGQVGRLHFVVPRGTKAFSVGIRGGGGEEQASVQAFTPTGRAAGVAATGPDDEGVLNVTVAPDDAGGVWSLVVGRGERGILGDASLWLSPDVPPFLAESPEGLAAPFIHYTARGALYRGDAAQRVVLDACIAIPPQADRLVRAAMSRAGSGRMIWATQPAPFSGGRVRVVLPDAMAPGSYDLKTALLENRTRLIGTHVQRVVVTPQFVFIGEQQPLVTFLPPADTGAAGPTTVRARLALDPIAAGTLGIRMAVQREGETGAAVQADLVSPTLPVMELGIPQGAPDGFCRLVASVTNASGMALGSATMGAFLQGGRLFLEEPAPAPARKTVLRSTQRARGYVLFTREYHEAFRHNYEPPIEDIGRPLYVWATPGEYEPATFGVYTLKALKDARITVGTLARDGGGGKIDPANVDVRLARFWPQRTDWAGSRYRVVPELLERVASPTLPTGRISQYWLTLRVPETTPPGDYRGTVTFRAANAPASSLKFILKVLPFKLAKPPSRTWGLSADSGRWRGYSPAEIEREMRDMKAHGIDTLGIDALAHGNLRYEGGKLSVDFGPLSQLMAVYRKAGLRGPVVLDLQALEETLARLRGRGAAARDAELERLYLVVLSDLAVRAAAEGWPEIACQVAGEAPGQPLPSLDAMRAQLALAKKAGLTTFCTVRDPAITGQEWDRVLDLWCYPARVALEDAQAAAALVKHHHAARKPFWWYGSGCDTAGMGQEGWVLPNRYLAGAAFWRSGAAGQWTWTFQRPVGDAYNDFDGAGAEARKDACLTYPAPGNLHASVPTIQWEALREGVDDARYLYTFQQMIAKGKASGKPRAVAYAKQVEREAQVLVDRLGWGATPTRVSTYDLHVVRKMLSKYMGTLLNKLKT